MVAQSHPPLEDDAEDYSAEERAAMRVYALARASVAHINVLSGEGEVVAQGSAFLWDGDGHILTNAHVVSGGSKFIATFLTPDKCALDATVLGCDACRDIAVLSVDPAGLPAACRKLRKSSREARVGQRVHVLGAPFGLSHSFTTGVVSAVGREIVVREGRVPLFNVIQTDAAVNTGGSGGPVLSSGGAVLGMTVAIASPSGAFAGVGFAIPLSSLRLSAEALIRSRGNRGPPCPALGLSFAPPRVARQLGLKSGLLVLSVRKGGAAEAAGVRGTRVVDGGRIVLGDVLIGVSGVDVGEAVDVWREVHHKRNVGDEVELKLRRQGAGELLVTAVLRDAHECGDDSEAGWKVGKEGRDIPRARL